MRKPGAERLFSPGPLLALLTTLLVGLLSFSGATGRLDDWWFDTHLRLFPAQADARITLVEIDEASLQALGAWPWSRRTHANLLSQLCAAQPAAIGFDIAFNEAAPKKADDLALAEAIRQCGVPVVLPLIIDHAATEGEIVESPPVSPLIEAGAYLGRVGVIADRDGLIRSVAAAEGLGRAAWPLFSQQLHRPQRVGDADQPPRRNNALIRSEALRIPFIAANRTFAHYSYIDLLEQPALAGNLKGQYILIGATAAGLGDFLPTPANRGSQLLSGVEVQANVLNAQRQTGLIRLESSSNLWPWFLLLSLTPLLWLARLSPLRGTALSLLWASALLGGASLILLLQQRWCPPAAPVLASLTLTAFWQLLQLEQARRHLNKEFSSLQQALGPLSASTVSARGGQAVNQRIQQIQQARAALDGLQKQRQDALEFISHDLRAPLATALLVLKERFPDSADKATLISQLQRTHQMAQQFVELARAEALPASEMRPLELGNLLYDAADALYMPGIDGPFTFQLEIPDDPLWVVGDYGLLLRALLNLAHNARTHGDPVRGGKLQLRSEQGQAVIRVVNWGTTISPDVLSGLFQRFRAENRGDARSHGIGLGLYFVRTITERLGGRVAARSAEGETCFEMTLPLAPVGLAGEESVIAP